MVGLRCDGCGAWGSDPEAFRAYFPGVSDEPERYCADCWEAREARVQRLSVLFAAGAIVGTLSLAALFLPGRDARLAQLALWLIACEVISTLLHEMAHYGTARGLGLRVVRVRFGSGRPLRSWQRGEVLWELCSFPTCGFVQFQTAGVARPRLKTALTALAGPALNLSLAILGLGLSGWDPAQAGDRLDLADVNAWHLLAGVNALIVVLNLVPFAYPSDPRWDEGEGSHANDGLLALRQLFSGKRG